jgi:hypothetical protein
MSEKYKFIDSHIVRINILIFAIRDSESLGLWTLSIVRNSKTREHKVWETESASVF